MSRYTGLRFFNGTDNELNLAYDSTDERWSGRVFLPEVSTGLYESFNLFIVEEFIDSNNGLTVYGTPISSNTLGSSFKFEWVDTRYISKDIFFYGSKLEDNMVKIQQFDDLSIQVLDHTNVVNVVNGLKEVNSYLNDALQVNIGLSSNSEKRHDRRLRIIDTDDNHIIAEIDVYGETVGEDERLKDLLQNFGATLEDGDFIIFKEHDVNEYSPDWLLMNQKRRELLLELHNIKPFVGTYKAILNAIDFFGYNNITLKEYWLNINQNSDSFGKLKAVPVPDTNTGFSYKKRKKFNLPSSTMKKTSRFSLVYKLNKPNGEFDYWDIPEVDEVFDFTPEEILIKLYGLKTKLQREYLPLQAKIVDITGEGSYFDQKNINIWNNQQPIAVFNEGKEVDFKVLPEDKKLYIEDYTLITDSGLLIDPNTFNVIELEDLGSLNNINHDNESLLSEFETFYNNYYINNKETFNNNTPGYHKIPVGCPLTLECTSLPQDWDSAKFTWNDAIDPQINWNNWWKQHVYELEWVITGPNGFEQSYRGNIGYWESDNVPAPNETLIWHPEFNKLAIIVPYSGDYNVELRMYDLYGFMSFYKKVNMFHVNVKPLELYGIYQWKIDKDWRSWKTKWEDTGGYWDLPTENLQKMNDSFQSLYLTMDRANYIHDESKGKIFSMVRRHIDTDLSNPTGFKETTGPYTWDFMDTVEWNDGKHNWWNATRVGMDLTASFKITDCQSGSILSIDHYNPITKLTENGTYTITSPTPTGNTDITGWQTIANELNSLTDPIISKFNFNPVFEDTNNDGTNDVFLFLLCVGKQYSLHNDFENVSLSNGTIIGELHYVHYNPTFDTVRIINGSAEVEKSTHVTFALDKSQMPGIKKSTWKIYNDSNPEIDDIYYDNTWLTYVFKHSGDYRIALEVEDTNGNYNIIERNMIIVK